VEYFHLLAHPFSEIDVIAGNDPILYAGSRAMTDQPLNSVAGLPGIYSINTVVLPPLFLRKVNVPFLAFLFPVTIVSIIEASNESQASGYSRPAEMMANKSVEITSGFTKEELTNILHVVSEELANNLVIRISENKSEHLMDNSLIIDTEIPGWALHAHERDAYGSA